MSHQYSAIFACGTRALPSLSSFVPSKPADAASIAQWQSILAVYRRHQASPDSTPANVFSKMQSSSELIRSVVYEETASERRVEEGIATSRQILLFQSVLYLGEVARFGGCDQDQDRSMALAAEQALSFLAGLEALLGEFSQLFTSKLSISSSTLITTLMAHHSAYLSLLSGTEKQPDAQTLHWVSVELKLMANFTQVCLYQGAAILGASTQAVDYLAKLSGLTLLEKPEDSGISGTPVEPMSISVSNTDSGTYHPNDSSLPTSIPKPMAPSQNGARSTLVPSSTEPMEVDTVSSTQPCEPVGSTSSSPASPSTSTPKRSIVYRCISGFFRKSFAGFGSKKSPSSRR